MPKVVLATPVSTPLCRQGAFVANPRRPTVTKKGILENDPTPTARQHRRLVVNPTERRRLRRENAFYGYTMSPQECRRLDWFSSQPVGVSSQVKAGMVQFYSQP